MTPTGFSKSTCNEYNTNVTYKTFKIKSTLNFQQMQKMLYYPSYPTSKFRIRTVIHPFGTMQPLISPK